MVTESVTAGIINAANENNLTDLAAPPSKLVPYTRKQELLGN